MLLAAGCASQRPVAVAPPPPGLTRRIAERGPISCADFAYSAQRTHAIGRLR